MFGEVGGEDELGGVDGIGVRWDPTVADYYATAGGWLLGLDSSR